MVSKTSVKGIGELITSSPTRAQKERKHPDRLNLILYRESGKSRYSEWFGDKLSEEDIYCGFLGCNVTDSTNVKRDRLFSFIHMVSQGKIQVSISESTE